MKTRDVLFWIFAVLQFFSFGIIGNQISNYGFKVSLLSLGPFAFIISIIGIEYLVYSNTKK